MDSRKIDLVELSDLSTPWCIYVAATLHIADHIAAGRTSIADLAAAAGCDREALHNLLAHLSSRGIFLEAAPGVFDLNEGAQGFFDPGQRLVLDLNGIGGRMAHAWSTLLTYTRTGKPGYSDVFGLPFFDDLAAHPEVSASFDALIGSVGHGKPRVDFEIEGGWDAVRSVVDVGGGTGSLLAEILRAHPHLHGILVDLPATVERSGAIFQAAGVTERVSISGQSFFDPLPRGADLYLLKSVIDDWPDEETLAILRRCAEAARPNGRVILLSGVAPDGTPHRLSIEMILVGGRQRTLSEFRALVGEAGLVVQEASSQQERYFIVECRPK